MADLSGKSSSTTAMTQASRAARDDFFNSLLVLENLTLTGKGAISGTGNDLANIIAGNSGANVLIGLDGNDTIDGGLGADKMTGGDDSDTFLRHSTAEGKDTIIDFETGG